MIKDLRKPGKEIKDLQLKQVVWETIDFRSLSITSWYSLVLLTFKTVRIIGSEQPVKQSCD